MGNTGAQNKYIIEYHLWAWPRFQGAPCHRAFVPDQWSRKLVPSFPLNGSIWHFGRNTFVFRIIFSGRWILCLLPAHILVGLEYEAEARSDSDIGAFYQDVLSKESIFPFSTFDRPLKEIDREPSVQTVRNGRAECQKEFWFPSFLSFDHLLPRVEGGKSRSVCNFNWRKEGLVSFLKFQNEGVGPCLRNGTKSYQTFPRTVKPNMIL